MKCCICENEIEPIFNKKGEVVWEEGNNAEPVVENGRCCDSCNASVVIPVRLGDTVLLEAVRKGFALRTIRKGLALRQKKKRGKK